MKKQTAEERLSRNLCPIGMRGTLRFTGQMIHGLSGRLGQGAEWTVVACDRCGFIAISDGQRIVPISSVSALAEFTAATEDISDVFLEKLEQVGRPIRARYDKATERLLAKMKLGAVVRGSAVLISHWFQDIR